MIQAPKPHGVIGIDSGGLPRVTRGATWDPTREELSADWRSLNLWHGQRRHQKFKNLKRGLVGLASKSWALPIARVQEINMTLIKKTRNGF